MTSEWLPRSVPVSLPPCCLSGWVSSQTGAIELAVTDSAALAVKMELVDESCEAAWEAHIQPAVIPLLFCRCLIVSFQQAVIYKGQKLKFTVTEKFGIPPPSPTGWQPEHLMTNNHSMNRYFSQRDLWSGRHFSFFLLIILSHACCDTPDDLSAEVSFSPRETTLFTERPHLSLSL